MSCCLESTKVDSDEAALRLNWSSTFYYLYKSRQRFGLLGQSS